MAEFGDMMMYVPHSGHFNEKDADGHFLFDFEHDNPTSELHGQKVEIHLIREGGIKSRAHSVSGRPTLFIGHSNQQVKVSGPNRHWKAKCIGIYPDGTAKLEIQHPNPGLGTREYDNVPIVDADMEPKPLHSCYLVETPKQIETEPIQEEPIPEEPAPEKSE